LYSLSKRQSVFSAPSWRTNSQGAKKGLGRDGGLKTLCIIIYIYILYINAFRHLEFFCVLCYIVAQ